MAHTPMGHDNPGDGSARYLGLDGAGDDTLLAAMAAHPSLMQRPVAVTDRGAKLCGEDEAVEGLL